MAHCNFYFIIEKFKKHKKLIKASQLGEDKDGKEYGVHDNDHNDDRL